MALKAWYPLNMNVNNYGSGNLDLIETATPTYVSGGKTGASALNQGGFKWSAAQTASVLNNDAFSYACWIKPTPTTPSSDRAMIFGNNSPRQFSIFQYNTANDLHLSWHKNGVDSAGGTLSVVRSGVLPSNVWTHVAVTYSKATGYVCIYINGSLDWSKSGVVMTSPSYEKETQVIHNSAFHQLNDVRIYDHCLSQLEVSEIYETLVLHYPLNRLGPKVPQLNMYAGINDVSQYTMSNPYTRTTTSTDGYAYLPSSRVPVAKLTTYRIQCSCDGVLATSRNDRDGLNKFTLWLYVRNEGTTKGETGYDSALNLNSTSYSHVESNGNRHTWYYTTSSTVQDIGLRTNLYSDGTTKVTLHFWDFSFSRADTEITDCSGRMSYALSPQSPTIQADSPRYGGATVLDGTNKYIHGIYDPINAGTTEFSIAMWFRANSVSGNQCLWNGRTTTDAGVAIFLIGNKIRTDDSAQDTSSTTITANTWYHLAMTWKSGGKKIVYLNGSEIKNNNAGNLSGKNNWLATIGRSSSANVIADSNYFAGAISDVRVYMTQLSPARITALYRRGAAVDPNGRFSCMELNEGSSAKTQVSLKRVNTPGISELDLKYDGKLYVEPDGSMWVRIVRQNNPASYRFTRGDAFEGGIYRNSGNTWANIEIMNRVSKWEFMVKQKLESSSSEVKYRWVQSKNPLAATVADVAADKITKVTSTTGYTTFSTGGLYKTDTANTYLCTTSGWWGAICVIAAYQGGMPAWGNGNASTALVKTGYSDLYIRVDNMPPFPMQSPGSAGIRKDDGTVKAREIREG